MKNFTGPNPELALRVFACYPGPDGGAPLLDVDFPLLFDFDFFAASDNFFGKISSHVDTELTRRIDMHTPVSLNLMKYSQQQFSVKFFFKIIMDNYTGHFDILQ